ncbi:MAG: ABC transporter ATP-binding protein [Pseudorhodoplanes sp.]|jgi:ABC-type branched-subunit amino acid transport system ATPase component|nr:ABC transporter ATP-binding protein [Pseudorhodoplanes sp.]
MSALALETRNLGKAFGSLVVARSINFKIAKGDRSALIGPNGAGKTTFINLLTGVLEPSAGQVMLMGREITQLSRAERVKLGLARTFQINSLFTGLSVLENVCMSIAERTGSAMSFFRPLGRNSSVIDEGMALLARLGMAEHAAMLVSELPYGRQRLVEIAIALGLEPKVLLLDEPAAGVPKEESHLLLDIITELCEDMAVLIIEHDMDLVFRFAKHITVLVRGGILVQGTPREIRNDQRVKDVYLGEGGHA